MKVGTVVDIQRSDGRVHSATISAIEFEAQTVTVSWPEFGETKGKEVDFEALYVLNPDLKKEAKDGVPALSALPVWEKPKATTQVGKKGKLPRPSYVVNPASFVPVHPGINGNCHNLPSQNKPSRRSVLKPIPQQNPSRSPNDIVGSTTKIREIQVFPKIKSVGKQKEQNSRNVPEHIFADRSDPNWMFIDMISEFRQLLDFEPLTDKDKIVDHQITVATRKRPLNTKELANKEIDIITIPQKSLLYVHEPKTKVDLTKYMENQRFRFDYTFNEFSDNELVYKFTARPLVDAIFKGGMATCFAYGQTGSGKTHTMGGDFLGDVQECNKGIYALASRDVFKIWKSKKYSKLSLRVSISFFEIYGGKVFDLLDNKKKLRVLEDSNHVVQVVGLQEVICECVDDVQSLLVLGSQIRTSGQTAANIMSSRSHAVLQIILRDLKKIEFQSDKHYKLHGKLSLIDLAGNERGADTASESRQTRMEGSEINKSLLALKECIRALGRKGAHLPFRASTLTQVLRESFIQEKSKTCMIAMVSPGASSCENTLNTLRYADRVKELGKAADEPKNSKPVIANQSLNEESSSSSSSNCSSSSSTSNVEDDVAEGVNASAISIGAFQEAEEELVEAHGRYFTHRDEMDKVLIDLFEQTNDVGYNIDGYSYSMEEVALKNIEYWEMLKTKLADVKQHLNKKKATQLKVN